MAILGFHNQVSPFSIFNRMFKSYWRYLASQRIVKHWHARCQNWDMVLSQLDIMFADRKVG